jgi:hypothetical protein
LYPNVVKFEEIHTFQTDGSALMALIAPEKTLTEWRVFKIAFEFENQTTF